MSEQRQVWQTDQPEAQWCLQVPRIIRRQRAQYFTPWPIAACMARWVLGGRRPTRLLDPACGLGVLLRACEAEAGHQHRLASWKTLACENDREIAEHARQVMADLHQSISWYEGDYLQLDWQARFDAIIANPPYRSFRKAQEREAELAELKAQTGITLSGFSNVYVVFLLKALHQLAPGGRCAFLIPGEFLQSDYGVEVRRWLVSEGSLRWLIGFDGHEKLFAGALTTSCLLFFEKSASPGFVQRVTGLRIEQISELSQALQSEDAALKFAERCPWTWFQPERKWLTEIESSLSATTVPFRQLARVRRGLATGANDYFLINEPRATAWKLPHDDLEPVIVRAQDVPGPVMTRDIWESRRNAQESCWLLQVREPIQPTTQVYLEEGGRQGVPERHLPRHRRPWYRSEQTAAAPVLMRVFNRQDLLFVRNLSGLRHLTAFHGIYPLDPSQPFLDLLMAFLWSPLAQECFLNQRREYGGGLIKLEPNDVQTALVPDLHALEPDRAQALRICSQQIQAAVLQGQPLEHLRAELAELWAPLAASTTRAVQVACSNTGAPENP